LTDWSNFSGLFPQNRKNGRRSIGGGALEFSSSCRRGQGLGLTFQTNDGPVQALSNVGLSIGKGEFVSFIGPSGCGKTTFLRTIADLERPTAGSLTVNGMTPEQARQARAYGYVFQAAALLPWRTIEKNAALPLEIMGISASEQHARIKRTLELVNLAGFEKNIRGSFPAACNSAPRLRAHWRSTPICS
jgi:ABC-type nitrate/sulfonate/bicarbonate transport system ATPase subunit